MPDPQANGQIAQVLIELGKLSTGVAVLATKFDSIPVADHENRLRSLERFKWMLMGSTMAGGGLAGYLAGLAAQHHP